MCSLEFLTVSSLRKAHALFSHGATKSHHEESFCSGSMKSDGYLTVYRFVEMNIAAEKALASLVSEGLDLTMLEREGENNDFESLKIQSDSK